MTAADVLRRHRFVLLDFDGPVCAVFGDLKNRVVAEELRGLLTGELPDSIAHCEDPFAVLAYAAERDDHPEEVEARMRDLEVQAVATAPSTEGSVEVLQALHGNDQRVVVVSNNSEEAVDAYFEAHNLRDRIAGISARTASLPGPLKPNPFLLNQALSAVDGSSSEAVMIGDSLSDIVAAQRAGTSSIGYANKPGKREKFAAQEPSAIIDHMAELVA